MKKKNNKKYSILILVLLILLGSFYFVYPSIEKSVRCPDEWYQVRQTFNKLKNDSFVFGDEVVNPSSDQIEWVINNCEIEPKIESQ